MTDRVEISKKLILINSASSLLTRMLSISVLVWLQQYLLDRVGVEEYSIMYVLYQVMMFTPLFTTVLTSGIGRYITEAYAQGDDKRVAQIVSTMFPILCAAGLILLAGGWAFAWHVDSFLKISPERVRESQIMMALLVFPAATSLVFAPFEVGFFVRQKFVLQNLLNVSIELIRLTILFTLLFSVSTRVMWVVVASVSSAVLGQIASVIISTRLLPVLRFRVSEIYWPIARELTGFGSWNFLSQLSNTIRTSADALILNRLGTPLDVANFQLGSLPMKHTQATVISVRGALQPSLTALHGTGDTARLGRVYLKGGRYGLWGIQLLVWPLIIFSTEIYTLYVGAEFSDAAIVMVLLLLTFPMAYGNMMLPQIATATGEIKFQALCTLALHATNLALTFYLVGYLKMGAVGSAFATFLASLLYNPLLLWPLGLRLAHVRWKTWLRETMLPGFVPSFPGIACWMLYKWFFNPSTWLSVGIGAMIGGVVYMVTLYYLCLQGDDRVYLDKIKRKIVGLVSGRISDESQASH